MDKLEDNFAKKNESLNSQRYIQFDLGPESYAIELLMVKEVIPFPETTPLPNSPKHYIGIMNLRGQIISVVDLRKKLNIKPKEKEQEEAVIIVEFQGVGIGVVVDSINRVLNIKENELTEVPELASQVNAKYIQGVYQGEDKLTVMLDLERLLDIKEITEIQKKSA